MPLKLTGLVWIYITSKELSPADLHCGKHQLISAAISAHQTCGPLSSPAFLAADTQSQISLPQLCYMGVCSPQFIYNCPS